MELRAPFRCLIPLFLVACSATGSLNVKDAQSEDGQKQFDKPIDPNSLPYDDEEEEERDPEPALLGARQDLMFNGPATTQCKCLAVAVGQGPNPAFGWENQIPNTNPETQLVVALDAMPCDGAEVGEGVSYRGFRVEGANVIIQIERAHPGRPKTVGAVIPKPYDDGSVFLEGVKGMVHGQAVSGKGLCALGNPGPRRASDVGTDKAMGTTHIFAPVAPPPASESLEPAVPADAAEPEPRK